MLLPALELAVRSLTPYAPVRVPLSQPLAHIRFVLMGYRQHELWCIVDFPSWQVSTRIRSRSSRRALRAHSRLWRSALGPSKTAGARRARRHLSRHAAAPGEASDLFCTSEHQDAHEFLQASLGDSQTNSPAKTPSYHRHCRQHLLRVGSSVL